MDLRNITVIAAIIAALYVEDVCMYVDVLRMRNWRPAHSTTAYVYFCVCESLGAVVLTFESVHVVLWSGCKHCRKLTPNDRGVLLLGMEVVPSWRKAQGTTISAVAQSARESYGKYRRRASSLFAFSAPACVGGRDSY